MEPSRDYEHIMSTVHEKIYLSKVCTTSVYRYMFLVYTGDMYGSLLFIYMYIYTNIHAH